MKPRIEALYNDIPDTAMRFFKLSRRLNLLESSLFSYSFAWLTTASMGFCPRFFVLKGYNQKLFIPEEFTSETIFVKELLISVEVIIVLIAKAAKH